MSRDSSSPQPPGGAPPSDIPFSRPPRLRVGFATSLSSQLAVLVTSLGISVLTARGLGTAGKGLLTVLLQASSISAMVFGLGLGFANSYFVGRGRRTPSQAASDSLAACATLAMLAMPTALVIMWLSLGSPPSLKAPALLAMLIVPAALVSAAMTGILNGSGRIRAVALIQSASSASGLVALAVLFAMDRLSLQAAVGVSVASAFLLAILGLGAVLRFAERPRLVVPSLRRVREQANYSMRAWVTTLLSYADRRVDVLILASLATPSMVGIYSVGVAFTELLWQVPRAVATTLFAHTVQPKHGASEMTAAATARVTMLLTLIAAVAMILTARPILILAYSSAFAGAADVVFLLLPGALVYGTSSVLMSYFMASDKLLPQVFAVATVLNVGVNIALIPSLGYRGAAIASTISYGYAGLDIARRFSAHTGIPVHRVFIPRLADVSLVKRVLLEQLARLMDLAKRRHP